MKVLVGYNGGEVGKLALSLARDFAKINNAFVYIITSMEGGASEKQSDILKAEQALDFAKELTLLHRFTWIKWGELELAARCLT